MPANETTRLLDAGSASPPSGEEDNRGPPTRSDAPQLQWTSPSDPENPKTWRPLRKWSCAMLVSFYCLVAPTAAAMVVPAMPALAKDLEITSKPFLQLTMSVFVLGWTAGPLILGPLSEVFGRASILHTGQIGFTALNLLCTFTTNKFVFLALRLLSGFCGSGPTSLGTGVLSDLWNSNERGTSLAVYTLLPLLGPTIGPIVAGYTLERYSWHYIFYTCSALSGLLLIPGVLALPETFGPVILLRRRAQKLEEMGMPASHERISKSTTTRVKNGLSRPFILLGTQPIIQVLAVYFGFYFGLYQLSIATYHAMWKDLYEMSPFVASVNYLAISVGLIIGCEISGPLNDKIYRTLTKHSPPGRPEYRTLLMVPAAILVPMGLVLFGWASDARAHVVLPNVGMATACAGLVIAFVCMQSYVMDAYPVYAASAQGALTILRALSAFGMPSLVPVLVGNWGYGISCTVLASIAFTLGLLAPALLWYTGPRLRARSKFAAGEVDLERVQ